MSSEQKIVEAVYALSRSLPFTTLNAVATAIESCSEGTLKAEVSKRVAHHEHRDQALGFIEEWKREAAAIDARAVAIALRSTALSEQTHRDAQSVELVWTGPDVDHAPFRRTEQAILQVLDSARHRITLVSFAVYRIPNIGRSLVRAAKRGVRLTVIVETPDKVIGAGEYSTIQALGSEVAACSTVYYWPKENRPLGENNKAGILHVKCAVADGESLFLSSANLTQQAFTINMELGMLIRGGSMPSRVEQRFDCLIQDGVLQRI